MSFNNDKYDLGDSGLCLEWKTSRPVDLEEQYDWEEFYLEIIKRACSPHGLPLSSQKLQCDISQWCKLNWRRCPDDSLLQAKILPVYLKLKSFSKHSALGFCPHRYS